MELLFSLSNQASNLHFYIKDGARRSEFHAKSCSPIWQKGCCHTGQLLNSASIWHGALAAQRVSAPRCSGLHLSLAACLLGLGAGGQHNARHLQAPQGQPLLRVERLSYGYQASAFKQVFVEGWDSASIVVFPPPPPGDFYSKWWGQMKPAKAWIILG